MRLTYCFWLTATLIARQLFKITSNSVSASFDFGTFAILSTSSNSGEIPNFSSSAAELLNRPAAGTAADILLLADL